MRSTTFTILGVLTLGIGLCSQNYNLAAQDSAGTIATVNTEAITQADLDHARKAHADVPLGTLLVDLVDERVLAQRGKSLGYAVSDSEFATILDYLKRQNGIKSDDQLDTALRQTSLTRAQLRSNLERVVIAQRVLGTQALAQVPDEDARRYFESHLDDFPLQTFDSAKDAVIERLKADRTTHNVLARPYVQSLRRDATIVWTQPDLQQAYEQASR